MSLTLKLIFFPHHVRVVQAGVSSSVQPDKHELCVLYDCFHLSLETYPSTLIIHRKYHRDSV